MKKLMKTFWLALVGTVAICLSAQAQGTFIFDQQSSTTETAPIGSFGTFQNRQPFGQSFIPSLSSISFVRLFIGENSLSPQSSVYVNLLSDSITGTVIATSSTIDFSGPSGYTNFFFPNPISLAPGTTYYLQPVASSGSPLTQAGIPSYANGTLFMSGLPVVNDNLWFREGIVVPEPSTFGCAIVGFAILSKRFRKGKQS